MAKRFFVDVVKPRIKKKLRQHRSKSTHNFGQKPKEFEEIMQISSFAGIYAREQQLSEPKLLSPCRPKSINLGKCPAVLARVDVFLEVFTNSRKFFWVALGLKV